MMKIFTMYTTQYRHTTFLQRHRVILTLRDTYLKSADLLCNIFICQLSFIIFLYHLTSFVCAPQNSASVNCNVTLWNLFC